MKYWLLYDLVKACDMEAEIDQLADALMESFGPDWDVPTEFEKDIKRLLWVAERLGKWSIKRL
jgi:hypothetical protein